MIVLALEAMFTASFAFSGALVALRGGHDAVGAIILAIVTAVGGGTVRDILIGAQPIFWLGSEWVIYLSAATGLVAYYTCSERHMEIKWMKMLDGLGLAYFSILGLERAIQYGAPLGLAVFLGIISGSFGGLMRDTLSNEKPFIFGGELYVTAALAGCFTYILIPDSFGGRFAIALLIILLLRMGGIFLGWTLPLAHSQQQQKK